MSQPRFLKAALEEAEAAADWYEQQCDGLGAEFMGEVVVRVKRAIEMPGAGRIELKAPERFQLRWYKVRRFPYAVLMGAVAEQRLVVAVAHERRRPGYWRRRLR